MEATELPDSELISRAMTMAKVFGGGGKFSNRWANADYLFGINENEVMIHLRIYAMGDNELSIYYDKAQKLNAKEKSYPNPSRAVKIKTGCLVMNRDYEMAFEINSYLGGKWENLVNEAWQEINKRFSKKQLADLVGERTFSKVIPEEEKTNLYERLRELKN